MSNKEQTQHIPVIKVRRGCLLPFDELDQQTNIPNKPLSDTEDASKNPEF